MKNSSVSKKPKTTLFQVLLLDNDANDEVEVQEADRVDFFQVKKHLKNGGSVFITSKDTQKPLHPKSKSQMNCSKSRRTYGALFRQRMRSS